MQEEKDEAGGVRETGKRENAGFCMSNDFRIVSHGIGTLHSSSSSSPSRPPSTTIPDFFSFVSLFPESSPESIVSQYTLECYGMPCTPAPHRTAFALVLACVPAFGRDGMGGMGWACALSFLQPPVSNQIGMDGKHKEHKKHRNHGARSANKENRADKEHKQGARLPLPPFSPLHPYTRLPTAAPSYSHRSIDSTRTIDSTG